MIKQSAHWVPRLLTLHQKRVWMNISNCLLAQFKRNKRVLAPIDYCRWSMDAPLYSRNKNTVETVDCEERIGPKKSKNCFFGSESDGDCLGSDIVKLSESIIFKQTKPLLKNLRAEFAEKRPNLLKKILVLQDNTLFHTSAVVMAV